MTSAPAAPTVSVPPTRVALSSGRRFGASRQVILTTLALLVIAIVAAIVFFDTARSSPDRTQFVPAFGSNPGVRGEGGR